MPYRVDKSVGGDNPANTKFMEGCVKAVEGTKGKNGKVIDKSSAIAICKASLQRRANKKDTSKNA